MEHRFLTLFVDGKWTGNPDRTIRIKGEVHNMDEYAAENGIVLPDSKPHKKHKKQINTDIEEKDNADMGQPSDGSDTELDGDGDSKGTK